MRWKRKSCGYELGPQKQHVTGEHTIENRASAAFMLFFSTKELKIRTHLYSLANALKGFTRSDTGLFITLVWQNSSSRHRDTSSALPLRHGVLVQLAELRGLAPGLFLSTFTGFFYWPNMPKKDIVYVMTPQSPPLLSVGCSTSIIPHGKDVSHDCRSDTSCLLSGKCH